MKKLKPHIKILKLRIYWGDNYGFIVGGIAALWGFIPASAIISFTGVFNKLLFIILFFIFSLVILYKFEKDIRRMFGMPQFNKYKSAKYIIKQEKKKHEITEF